MSSLPGSFIVELLGDTIIWIQHFRCGVSYKSAASTNFLLAGLIWASLTFLIATKNQIQLCGLDNETLVDGVFQQQFGRSRCICEAFVTWI